MAKRKETYTVLLGGSVDRNTEEVMLHTVEVDTPEEFMRGFMPIWNMALYFYECDQKRKKEAK